MTDKATHTPLPWTIDKYGAVLRDGQTIVTEGFALSGSVLAKQNTAFIVHAVNSHHDLIEALREARDLLLAIEQNDQNVWWVNHDDPEKAVCDTYSKVWSALTKAEAGHG